MRTQVHGQEWTGGGRGRGPAAGRGSINDGQGPARGAAAGPAAPRPTSTTSYAQQPVTHRIENLGTTLVRNMIVVNETAGDETTTEQAAGFDAKPELTNRWFRAYRIVLGPKQTTASHRHRAPVAIIQATAGKGLGSGRATWEFNQPGQWGFFDADDAHDFRNVGDSDLELIEVEVRRK
jgi:quercetin dioxygenase-like cupin family protein